MDLTALSRTGIENLEPLTSTDIKQAWGKLKAAPLYAAREHKDLCHVEAPPPPPLAPLFALFVYSMMRDTFRGNSATRYGKECEPKALDRYMQMTGDAVTWIGFVVHPDLPWLGYSPDSVIFKNGG
ncbi:uncharacterized protein LOC125756844 [Rhipicephalus sanguineus]|uniref:uncharacterized protein LOC125756844 n=1 Tax=Rhipicephalus sanguineus TaxID=34632 RepID=UPI0020C2D042|nr:uncharacterized protein LOC125756844 [Rhipicephalus sanguineus]